MPPPPSLAWAVWGLGALFYLFAFYQRVAPAVMTDRLMADFALDAAALGNLSAFYFYAYVAMQIPTGVMADRVGPRRLLTAGAIVAAIGSFLFALAPSFFFAATGRLLIGASVAVAFVATLKLASQWFAPNRYALASGMALFFGVVGGIMAGVPLRVLVETFGWREVMAVAGLFATALAVLIWLIVRDDPHEHGYASPAEATACDQPPPVREALAQVLSYRNVWLLMAAPIGFSGAVLAFGGLWGVPWLKQVHGLDAKTAAAITSLLLAAWALGGPLLGSWSQRLGARKPLYLLTGAIACAGWAAVVFLPLPLPVLAPLLIVIGFASGNIIIGFAWAKESLPLRLMGTASGVVNMGPLLGGMLLQPLVGHFLDRQWQGAFDNGARIFSPAAWQGAFSLFFAASLVALCLVPFARETHCRQCKA